MLSLLYGPTFTSVHDYWKNRSFDYAICWHSDVSVVFRGQWKLCCQGQGTVRGSFSGMQQPFWGTSCMEWVPAGRNWIPVRLVDWVNIWVGWGANCEDLSVSQLYGLECQLCALGCQPGVDRITSQLCEHRCSLCGLGCQPAVWTGVSCENRGASTGQVETGRRLSCLLTACAVYYPDVLLKQFQ